MLAALLWLAPGSSLADEPVWTEIAREDGVAVSAWSPPDRLLPLLRAVTRIRATPYEIMAVIQDVGRHSEWMHNCSEARLLLRESESVAYFYTRNDLPWPVADRDAVLRSEIVEVTPGRELRTTAASSDGVVVPEVRGVVRMPRLVGSYRLRASGDGITRVEYELDIDPGGRLPGWVAARTTRDLPLYTLRNLRLRVAATRGHYDDWLARWDPARRAD